MAFSIFEDKSHQPTDVDLAEVLGRSHTQWQALIAHASEAYAPLMVKWGFTGAKWGWSVRLIQKKRTVLYMTPRSRYFIVGLVLGEKAVKAAHASKLPADVLKAIDAAPKYAEGRGLRLEVRTKKDLAAVQTLAGIKMG